MNNTTLTRLSLTRSGQQVGRQDWHELIVSVATQPDDGRILWAWPSKDTILIQAGAPISPDTLPGLVSAATSGPVRAQFGTGEQVQLSTIATPTKSGRKRRPDGTLARGITVPIPVSEYPQWLSKRLADVIDITEQATEPLRSVRVRKLDRVATFSACGYYVAGAVTDPERLRELIVSGIGDGRAYGMGLVVVGAAS